MENSGRPRASGPGAGHIRTRVPMIGCGKHFACDIIQAIRNCLCYQTKNITINQTIEDNNNSRTHTRRQNHICKHSYSFYVTRQKHTMHKRSGFMRAPFFP